MKNIILEHNYHYRWHTKNGLSFKGFVFDPEYNLCTSEQVFQNLENASRIEEFEGIISKLDGSFCIVTQTPNGIFLATDFMSAFPVFYTLQEGSWIVSDNSDNLFEILKEKKFNHSASAEFEGAGFVLGNQTLLQGIFKTQAAEIVHLKPDGSVSSIVYSRWLPQTFFKHSRKELKIKLANLLDKISDNLVNSLKGQHVVVPLSGGFDSRLIACMLHSQGYQNVTCLTYGRPSQESFLAEKVARQLGFRWIFVNYQDLKVEGYLESPTFNKYRKYAGNNYSMPYLQDYFAVKYLKENNLIPDHSFFVPGHSGDFLAGSYVNKTLRPKMPKSELPKFIFEKYFNFGRYNSRGKIKVVKRLQDWFAENEVEGLIQHTSLNFWVEEWDIKEKLSKFIFQSVQVFPFFGYGFRIPLWSKPLRDFFRQTPFEFRKNKNLYDEVLIESFFKPRNVFFETAEIAQTPSHTYLTKIKKNLKNLTPQSWLYKKIATNDVICYQRLTAPMKERIESNSNFETNKTFCFNNIICKWYVERTRKEHQSKVKNQD